jgi:hypothetical protein
LGNSSITRNQSIKPRYLPRCITMTISRPCLTCRQLTTNPRRCPDCQTTYNRLHPKPKRPHYSGDYQARAKAVRDSAQYCWICLEGARVNDPWTADHVIPGDVDSPLLPAHRSCNSRRGDAK